MRFMSNFNRVLRELLQLILLTGGILTKFWVNGFEINK